VCDCVCGCFNELIIRCSISSVLFYLKMRKLELINHNNLHKSLNLLLNVKINSKFRTNNETKILDNYNERHDES